MANPTAAYFGHMINRPINDARWQAFVDSFGLNPAPGLRPWDAELASASVPEMSPGDAHAVRFLLSVWNPNINWTAGRFAITDAVPVWGESHRDAFLAWVANPWRP